MLSYSGVPYRVSVLTLCCAAALAGCTKTGDRAAQEGMAKDTAATAPAAPATISLSAVAGKWQMRATDADGSNVVEYVLTATADSSDWTIVGAGRAPIPERVVAVAGDSIVTEAGPYESFIRKGVQVRTRDVYRLRDGKLVSALTGWYATPSGDSVSHRQSEGSRLQ